MITIASTFTSGLTELIKKNLLLDFPSTTIEKEGDGIILFTAELTDIEKIKNIAYLNNSFYVIKVYEKPDHSPMENMFADMMNVQKLERCIMDITQGKTKSIRIVISKANQNIRIRSKLLDDLENRIKQIKNITINKSKASIELWFISRSEGFGLCAIRLTRPSEESKFKEQGELKNELAWLLNKMVESTKESTILDPTAGHGGMIVMATQFPHKQILAGDIDPKMVDALRLKAKKNKYKITTGRWDSTNLRTFSDNSIERIISDPPWGFYNSRNLNISSFYENMLKEAERILTENGIAVYLIGQKAVFEKAIKKSFKLKPLEKYDILVNGKKATIFKVTKKS